MYATINCKTKKELKEAVKAGRNIGIFQPNRIGGTNVPDDGTVVLEGPHFPEPHKWYAKAIVKGGIIVSVE